MIFLLVIGVCIATVIMSLGIHSMINYIAKTCKYFVLIYELTCARSIIQPYHNYTDGWILYIEAKTKWPPFHRRHL